MPSTNKPDHPNVPTGLFHSKGWQVAMIGLGTATAQLDTSVNIAFPSITRGFDLTIGDIQWVVICYVLTYASLLLALGRVGDTVGHAIVFRIGLVWSAVALLLVSWSPSYGAMLVFRCLQGVGAARVLYANPRQAFGESLAHLNMLASIGRLTRDVDANGAITFAPA